MPTGEVVENGLPFEVFDQLAAIEISGEDYNAFSHLRLVDGRAASLSEATGGNLARRGGSDQLDLTASVPTLTEPITD